MESGKKYIAEFIGTAVLVLCGCGTAVMSGCNGEPSPAYLITALAFGGSIVAMAYSIGNISGCHINPAVSIGILLNGKMTVKDFIGYLIAQFAGGIAGAALLGYLAGFDCGMGTNGLFNGEIGRSFVIEMVLMFIFVLAVLGATSKVSNASVAGLVIGGSLTFVHLLGIPFTGTSVNPARSLGPALFAGGDALSNVWVFLLAPAVGGIIAGAVWRFFEPVKTTLTDEK